MKEESSSLLLWSSKVADSFRSVILFSKVMPSPSSQWLCPINETHGVQVSSSTRTFSLQTITPFRDHLTRWNLVHVPVGTPASLVSLTSDFFLLRLSGPAARGLGGSWNISYSLPSGKFCSCSSFGDKTDSETSWTSPPVPACTLTCVSPRIPCPH